MSRRSVLAVLLIAPQLMLGCATTSPATPADHYVSPNLVLPPLGGLVLLLHLPANEAPYRSGDATVLRLLQDALIELGYKVAVIEPADYRLALRAELQQFQQASLSRDQLNQAEMRALAIVSRVGSDLSGSQLLLRTRLLSRTAELWQSYAKWDGVTRPIVFADSKPGEVRANIQGTGSGASVEVMAIDRDGLLLLKSYGGLALPFYASRDGTPLLVDNPLSVQQYLQEGVAIAISPLKRR